MSEVVEEKKVRPRTSALDFVRTINTCSTIDEAAEKLGISVTSIRSRMTSLKKDAKDKGLNLRFKKLPSANRKVRGPATLDMEALVALSDELLGPEAVEAVETVEEAVV